MRRPATIETTARLPAKGAVAVLLAACLALLSGLAQAREQGPMRGQEPPRAAAAMSIDQAVAMAERRYQARVVRADTEQRGDRRIYVLRLLSAQGRVWTVRVNAATGLME